ncbi:MAG: ATP phosphoribosyltransferase [Lachnospiraceae bacterium]|nr:ATP phosphoribosyltransferase [Lachnospiraceae bacterium]
MSNILHTPEGVRDINPSELKKKIEIENSLLDMMRDSGYLHMQTPSFEYFDVFANNIGLTPSRELYKFYDKEGNTLVLRPDFTPAMARAYAKLYHNDDHAVKLCYSGNTFVNGSDLNGKLKESTQIGAELYNDDTCAADAGIIELVIKCMKTVGFDHFIVSVGNGNFFKGLFDEIGISSENKRLLLELISSRNLTKVREILEDLDVDKDLTGLIVHISDEYTTKDSLFDLCKKIDNEVCKKAVERLISIIEILEKKGIARYISVDLGLLNKYDYYTGVLFRAYAFGSGDAIIKGGRYDNLVKEFGKDVPAIGFGVSVDELLMALGESGSCGKKKDNDYLTFAFTKGRLADKTLALLEKAGITCEEMKDKDTRKLIFVNEDLKLKFFLAKGPDVPTYVEHGVADIGVVGKDTIDEENRKILEVLDLGFGKCRMCICGPESAKKLLLTRDMIKIATKYPRIAKTYFNDVRHQSVDIIKLNGSIELAPIVGLSDVIVDIVETGSTLRENGLVVLEEICDLSARMVVNPVSMRLHSDRINDMIDKIKEEL